MDVTDPEITEELREQAAYWFTRMHSGEATKAEAMAFSAWHDSNPLHAYAYLQASFAWQASLTVPHDRLRAILLKKDTPSRSFYTRRAFGIGATGACAAVLMAAIGAPHLLPESVAFSSELTTVQGERRGLDLPDGTKLYANTATQATVTFYEGRRTVNLTRGEIYLDVAHDPGRPFIVTTGLGEVKVTGTRFNVRHEPASMEVAVVAGSVQVSTGSWPGRHSASLTKGMQVSVNREMAMDAIQMVDVGTITAWQRGRIVVENMPLAQVVKELNRYLPKPALLNAPQLNQYRVTGSFDADRPQSMLDALPMIAPVTIYELTDGRYRIVQR